MSIKNNLNYIKNEFSNDEKILESAFKLEILYKRYKHIIWGLGILILFGICAYGIHSYYNEYNAKKYSNVYSSLLENPNDTALKEQLQKGNPTLYSMFILQQALKNGNLSELESLSKDKNSLISSIALYHLGSFDRNISQLEQVDKYALGDLSKLQQAYELIDENKISEAQIILDKIPQDSQLNELKQLLKHYMITKR
ncbi:hypothetical protein CCY99_01635 [Helicobacter sp. 16-1353]|uniref:hypothetical protein n=1 Tax=Helicobacter sp. 16-1353 TaxID=2004996 RepID=UPI000DCDF60C|nr:hypothetical protein [Helicobacter sp. 16-1353]RAX54874.1 hypothetical protein CCY99_01635 [Helicobacter sp. 16-1353]